MHLSQTGDERREEIKSVLGVATEAEIPQGLRIGGPDRGYRGEGNVGPVGHPVHPGELLDVRFRGRHAIPHPEVVIGRQGRGVDALAPRHAVELAVDDVEFVLAHVGGAVERAVEDPCVGPRGQGGGGFLDDGGGQGPVAFKVVRAGFATGGNDLDHVAELGYVFEDHANAEGADNFYLWHCISTNWREEGSRRRDLPLVRGLLLLGRYTSGIIRVSIKISEDYERNRAPLTKLVWPPG